MKNKGQSMFEAVFLVIFLALIMLCFAKVIISVIYFIKQ